MSYYLEPAMPVRDLSDYCPREELRCSACGEPACEDDPTWESQTIHLLCVPMEDVRAVVEAGLDEGYLTEAAHIAEMFAVEAGKKLKVMRDRREELRRRGCCLVCSGNRKVLVTAQPYPMFGDCTACGGTGKVRP